MSAFDERARLAPEAFALHDANLERVLHRAGILERVLDPICKRQITEPERAIVEDGEPAPALVRAARRSEWLCGGSAGSREAARSSERRAIARTACGPTVYTPS